MITFTLMIACYEPAPDSYSKDTDTGTGEDTTSGTDTDTGGGDTDTAIEDSDTATGDSDTAVQDSDTAIEDSDTAVVDTDTGPPTVEHCGDITADETWSATDGTHVVTCMVHVNGGTLTIEAGLAVTFTTTAGITVADAGAIGSLVVAGTSDAPVSLIGEDETTAGSWQGLRVEGYGSLQLSHANVVNAGVSKGAIHADGGEVLVDDVAVTGSATYGLQLENDAAFTDTSTNLRVSSCGDFPVRIGVESAASLPDGTWTGNTHDGIEVEGGTIETATTWPALDVPWVIASDIEIQGTREDPADWTLSPGITLAFKVGAGLSFSLDGGASSFIAEGTELEPVLLTAWDAPERGIWDGVVVVAGTETVRLVQATIEYGGGDGMLEVEGVDVYADALTLRGAPSAAFVLGEGSTFADGSGALLVEDSGWPGQLEAVAVDSLTTMDLDLLGADDDWLYVSVSDTVSTPMEWANLGLPYWLLDSLSLDGTADAPAVWTIDAGVSIYVAANKYIRVAHGGGAAGMLAVGTDTEPITFTAASSSTAGAWGGIGLYAESVDASCSFDHIDIGYGGGAGLSGNLHLDDASPTIDHATIHDSADYGIYRAGDSAPTIGEVAYSGNEDGDLF